MSTKNNKVFENELLKVGNGTWPQNEYEEMEYNETICNKSHSIQDLIDTVFVDFETQNQNHNWISERSILTLTNESADEINDIVLEKLPGTTKTNKSIDTTVDECESSLYPTEFLNSLNHSGISQHNLKLKIGSMIMLMRNLNPPFLCNGTKLIINNMSKYLIEATIVSGQGNL